MDDATGSKTGRVTVHFQLTVLSCVELSGDAEVAPQEIVGTSGYAVSHEDPKIQAQGSVDQFLAQGPGHHNGEPPGLACVSQDKYGIIILDEILQP